MADKRERALRSVDHVQVIEAKNGLTYTASSFATLLIQCTTAFTLCSASLGIVNRDPSPVPDEKGVVASGKSRSYSSFAFSCSKSAVIATSFSRCCRKYGNVSQHQIWTIGVQSVWSSLISSVQISLEFID